MDSTVLDPLPFQLDDTQVLQGLRIRAESGSAAEVQRLTAQARNIGRPKALYKLGYIEAQGDDYVVLGGWRFTSRVLRVNLDGLQRVFVYICTGGQELHTWTESQEDMLARYWADAISQAVLRSAFAAFEERLCSRYALTRTSRMNPGSLADWPIEEQRVLFAFLGDPEAAIGVRLTESLLMIPTKSVSGFLFPTEESFASCQLCPREICPNRRAPYDPDLFERKYRLQEHA